MKTQAHSPQPPAQSSTLESLASKIPLISLFLFNLLPLIGVIYLHWSVLSMMLIYWSESLIIGFFTILRMIMASQSPPLMRKRVKVKETDSIGQNDTDSPSTDFADPPIADLANVPSTAFADPTATAFANPAAKILLKLFLIPFFCFHFGIFMTVHLAFIGFFVGQADPTAKFAFFGLFFDLVGAGFSSDSLPDALQPLTASASLLPLALTFLSLFAYHLILFIFHYVRPRAYQSTNPLSEMFTPYPRIVITHLILIVVSALTITKASTLSPVIIASLIVGLKTFLDFFTYQPTQAADQTAKLV